MKWFKNKKQASIVTLHKCSYNGKEWYDVKLNGRLLDGGNMVSHEEAIKLFTKWKTGDFGHSTDEILDTATIIL